MNTTRDTARKLIPAAMAGLLVGALTLWLLGGDDARRLDLLREQALCILTLEPGGSETSQSIHVESTVEMFQVSVSSEAADQLVTLVISTEGKIVASATIDANIGLFGLGNQNPPGTYVMSLRRDAGDTLVEAVIATRSPVLVTGWQIWSRIFVALFALTGILTLMTRWIGTPAQRAISALLFHVMLLVSVLLFTYLLLHEGGHALAQISFGRFDLSRSDFWGLHGTPRSGSIAGPGLEPWKQALISASGPMLPVLAGWFLFSLGCTSWGRNIQSRRPAAALYWSALIVMLVFAAVVMIPFFTAGVVTSDGDWQGFIHNVPGPKWLVNTGAWIVFALSALVLWRTLPELVRAWVSWTAGFQIRRVVGDLNARP